MLEKEKIDSELGGDRNGTVQGRSLLRKQGDEHAEVGEKQKKEIGGGLLRALIKTEAPF